MFDYINETIRESVKGDNDNTIEDIKKRLAFCQDKLNNIKRLKQVPFKTFNCIDAREDITLLGIPLCIIDMTGDQEFYIKINNNQKLNVLLEKVCKALNKNPLHHELVYDNSTMNMNMNYTIHDVFILLNNYRTVENPGTLYLFEISDGFSSGKVILY
jgi:hypothetical protein